MRERTLTYYKGYGRKGGINKKGPERKCMSTLERKRWVDKG